MTYVKITKADLRGFDSASTELILWAQMRGAKVRISKRNHAIILGPNGRTAAVPRNMKMQNRGSQNARAGVARLFR